MQTVGPRLILAGSGGAAGGDCLSAGIGASTPLGPFRQEAKNIMGGKIESESAVASKISACEAVFV